METIIFEKWWQDAGSALPSEDPKTLARTTWDAALLAASLFLNAERDKLVRAGHFERAATARDLCAMLQCAFATSGSWELMRETSQRFVQIEWHRVRLRKLSTQDLEKIDEPDRYSEFSIALREVKRERRETTDPKSPVSDQ